MNIDQQLAAGQFLKLVAQLIDLRAPLPDNQPGARGINMHLRFTAGALDVNPRDLRVIQPLLDVVPQLQIFVQ